MERVAGRAPPPRGRRLAGVMDIASRKDVEVLTDGSGLVGSSSPADGAGSVGSSSPADSAGLVGSSSPADSAGLVGSSSPADRNPLVLFDATSVPADRGGVGRYVDGLLGALDAM